LVLYDKKSNFLGIGQNELSMLGFEDIEEFKSYHDDFADLFINHPGYISKFKNFSWIDYALHSGVPNKNVVLRHKNGTEIEATLNIMEVFLLNPINEENSIYDIEIDVSSTKNNFTITNDPHLNQKNIKLEPFKDDFETSKEKNQTEIQSSPALKQVPQAKKINFDDFSIDDYKEDYKEDTQTLDNKPNMTDLSQDAPKIQNDNFVAEKEDFILDEKPEEPAIKLKVDMSDDILNKNDETTNISFTEPEIKPKPEVMIQKDEKIETKNDTVKVQEIGIDDEELDFTQIAEDTGMDIEDLAMFMDEFINESKDTSIKLHKQKNATDAQSIKDEILQLKGIASNLKMDSFIKVLNLMFENSNSEEFESYLNKFDNKIKNLEGQLS